MKLFFRKNGIEHHPLKHWELYDGNTVAIYQGSRGYNPDLDFIIKYRNINTKLRAPSHTHWIVDLIIKAELGTSLIKDFTEEWIEIYNIIEPLKQKKNEKVIIYTIGTILLTNTLV